MGSRAARAVLLRTERGRERLREERDDRRAPHGSEIEGVEGAGAGLVWAKQAESRGRGE